MTLSINIINMTRRNSAAHSPITKFIETLKNEPKKFYEHLKNNGKSDT